MVKKIYKASKGAQFNAKKAQVYGECLDKISEKNNNTITPYYVIEEARSPRNPLHEVFDWDDNSAAEKYRLEQARHLINHLVVEVRYDHTKKEQKAFFNVTDRINEDDSERVYVNFERVLSDPEKREQVVGNALKELYYWKEKYNDYKEFGKIFMAIELTKRNLSKSRKNKAIKKKKI